VVEIVQAIPRRKNTWIELVAGNGERAKLPVADVPAGLADGVQLDPADWAALLDRAAYCQAFETCVRILARREHFPLELRNKLISRGIARDHINAALAACRERGYIDERRAAEQLVDTLAARGGIGRAKFRQALMQRGCPKELAQEMLATRLANLDESAEARSLLVKRSRSFAAKLRSLADKAGNSALSDPKERIQVYRKLGAAVMRYLTARGLTTAGARQAAAEFTRELMEDA
jgi:regulatory protein